MARLSLAALTATVFLSTKTSAYMGPTMGQLNDCDDGKSNLEVDWNPKDFTQFTCRNDLHFAVQDLDPIYYEIPNFDATTDMVMHKCMNESISYPENPPLRGDHRPNWAVWGEYLFIPMQRWLHNLEHGAIVMLYHPCVDEGELGKLRDLVTGCLYRHIITPYNGLSERYPLMLIAWGARLQLNQVAEDDVVRFIRKHAQVAPEDLSKQGQYDFQLLLPSRVVSDIDDTNLCPNHGNSTSMLGGNSVESRRD